jgi:SMC interacting uncharacterized protein involved in chromosome segregation
MKERPSKEIKAELRQNHITTKDIYSQIEKAEAKMREIVAGGLEWLTMDDSRKALKEQLPTLAEKKRLLTRELFGAITKELGAQREYNTRMHEALVPKVQEIFSELQETLRKYEERLRELGTPYLPEGMPLADFGISVQVAIRPMDFAPKDAAIALLKEPAWLKLSSLNSEWSQLRDELGMRR